MEKFTKFINYSFAFFSSQIKPNRNDVYALYNKKSSSFALFKGIDGEDFVPYQVSSKFLSRELDKFVENLRKWLVNFQLGSGNL